MSFTWRYEHRDGRVVEDSALPTTVFPTRSDAETWLGEDWRILRGLGVEQVVLLEDDSAVYGPMSLHPTR
ncbi:hypothetical protein CLV35_2522 [Motilibacter peucedani]|uniref:Uncharacterized protein n=1 Tax=Motilibacter peucedani TaxID=598650 RepID=A0A420XPB4_9ACTN|nr:hypothetical protein [Motilibacter peucedani]RKS74024.1 hypothetical protein CLV35_2522 [Motilibacter peucedani]